MTNGSIHQSESSLSQERAHVHAGRSILALVDAGTPQKLNTTALLAALTGVIGFCFWGIGGVLAIVLGITARTEIARSAGRESGNAAAVTGIALGVLNIASCVIAMAVGIAFIARPAAPPTPAPAAAPFAAAPTSPSPSASVSKRGAPAERSTLERSRREARIGSVRVVDISASFDRSLRGGFEREQRAASAAGERLVVFVVGPNCLPCNGVMMSLNDGRMQRALPHVRLLRVDASEFGADLSALGVPADTVPGFALLGAGQRVTDYVDGGEWDADVPQNIAPVLGPFIEGKYRVRRRQYQSEVRSDQTAL